jgi:AcrR family transcriptional regulator
MNARKIVIEDTPSRLCDAALTLFSEKGYSATSIRDIIHAADVTQPTLYYHFRDKADLFQKLVERHYGDSQQRLANLLHQISGCAARLHELVRSSFEYCVADPRIPRLMFQTAFGPRIPEIDGALDKVTATRFGLVKQIMTEGIVAGQLRRADPEFLSLSFCCLMDQPVNLFSRQPKPGKFLTPDLAATLVELFLQGAAS